MVEISFTLTIVISVIVIVELRNPIVDEVKFRIARLIIYTFDHCAKGTNAALLLR